MSLQDTINGLNNLDPDNIGMWPFIVRAVIWLLAACACGVAVYQFFLAESLLELEAKQDKKRELIETYAFKSKKAANLPELKLQMKEMAERFKALAKQLPNDTEVPGLVDELSQLGIDNGLEFESINLGAEKAEAFYVELPIQISVQGTYHALGAFVSGVAALPRIVTLHDFSIQPMPDEGPGLLNMSITAKTYRYNEGDV